MRESKHSNKMRFRIAMKVIMDRAVSDNQESCSWPELGVQCCMPGKPAQLLKHAEAKSAD